MQLLKLPSYASICSNLFFVSQLEGKGISNQDYYSSLLSANKNSERRISEGETTPRDIDKSMIGDIGKRNLTFKRISLPECLKETIKSKTTLY